MPHHIPPKQLTVTGDQIQVFSSSMHAMEGNVWILGYVTDFGTRPTMLTFNPRFKLYL